MDDLFEELLNTLSKLRSCDELHEDDDAELHSIELDVKAIYELSMDRRLRAAGVNPDAPQAELDATLAALTTTDKEKLN